MPSTLVDILRLGFPGLAAYFLYLAFQLSKQIVDLPAAEAAIPLAIAEKRKAVSFYGFLCVFTLVLSIGAEISKGMIKPPASLVKTSVVGQFSEAELKQRPLELSTWLTNDPVKTFKYFRISTTPNGIEIPADGGMIMVSIPRAGDGPN